MNLIRQGLWRPVIVIVVSSLALGFIAGYGVRSLVSHHHRTQSRLPVVVADDKAGFLLLDGPRRRENGGPSVPQQQTLLLRRLTMAHWRWWNLLSWRG